MRTLASLSLVAVLGGCVPTSTATSSDQAAETEAPTDAGPGSTCGGPDGCKDPEKEAGSYVSIGVMPAPYPISWQSPFSLFVTTLGTSAAAAGLDRSHSIGHVLLKVRCGSDEPYYISQTGANGKAAFQFLDIYTQGPSYLFVTQNDGKLYADADAKKDWDGAVEKQEALGDKGTYDVDPEPRDLGDAPWQLWGMSAVKKAVRDLAPVSRHRFVRATIRLTDAQCKAIGTWRDEYVKTGGATRYAVHRAPWVMDTAAKYDGGGCASVGFAGAFYAAGLDFKQAATRVTERLAIGTSRLPNSIIKNARKPNGWFNVQNSGRYVPGSIPCAKEGDECYSASISWDDPHWQNWSGGLRPGIWGRDPKDDEGSFSKAWETNKAVKSRIVPLIIFEPERFYKEILGRWTDDKYAAFTYSSWCKIPGKVPTIVYDARQLTGRNEVAAGRPKGIVNGFLNTDTMLPAP